MRQVYIRQVTAACQVRSFVDDVEAAELETIESGVTARKEAAGQCRALLLEARRARSSDASATSVASIGVVSGHLSATHQLANWNRTFAQYYARTEGDRKTADGGEFSPAAASLLTRYISRRLAAPGFSMHNNGLAIDFCTTESRVSMGASTDPKNIANWRASWFFSWLNSNANGYGLFQNTSIDEPWHWEFRGRTLVPATQSLEISSEDTVQPTDQGSRSEGYATESTIAAGRLPIDDAPLLAKHGGAHPDLILRWNDMADPSTIDIVIHLHGYSFQGAKMPLREKELISGLDFSDPTNAANTTGGRSAPTLCILPRGAYTGNQPGANSGQYTFPALVTDTAISDLVTYSLERFSSSTALNATPSKGRLILTAHSGGGAALVSILAHNNPDEIQIFDALYSDATRLLKWAKSHIEAEIAGWIDGQSRAIGGLCILYRSSYLGKDGKRHGTEDESLRVGRAIETAIEKASAVAQPILRAAYRVLHTEVPHNDIPSHFGYKLLADFATQAVVSPKKNSLATEYAEKVSAVAIGPILKASACAYFFKGTQYVRYNLAADAIDVGPVDIALYWRNFPPEFQKNLNASVNWGDGHAYFFKGSRYLRYNIATDVVDGAPAEIATNWTQLPEEFQRNIDAAVNWGNGKAYFFKGARYLRYDILADRVDNGPVEIKTYWPALPASFQSDLDGVVNWGDGHAYFFKGTQYVRYVIATDTLDIEPTEIATNWPALPSGFHSNIRATINWTYPIDLAGLMRAAGLTVTEIGDWRAVRSSGAWTPVGIIMHHTGGRDSLAVVVNGDGKIPGPRANFLIDKLGTVKVISGGHANHAGHGAQKVLDELTAGLVPSGTAAQRGLKDSMVGNSFFYGFENENWGDGVDPWPEPQLDAMARAAAALCHLHGWRADRVIAHKEWTSRKPDPSFSMGDFRSRVSRFM